MLKQKTEWIWYCDRCCCDILIYKEEHKGQHECICQEK